MPSEDTAPLGSSQKRCPVCWTWFAPNSPSNPHPRRYCCAACRIEDSRRRRQREQTQLLLDAKLDLLHATRHAQDQRQELSRAQSLLDERTPPMNPD